MSQSQVPALCDTWTGWNDVDFYLLKLRLDRAEGIGFLYYFLHPKQAIRDLRLWVRFTLLVMRVKRVRAKTRFTGIPRLAEVKKPSLFSRIKSWFTKKPKTETHQEYIERRIEERAKEEKEEQVFEGRLNKIKEALEKRETKDEQKPVDENDKKE